MLEGMYSVKVNGLNGLAVDRSFHLESIVDFGEIGPWLNSVILRTEDCDVRHCGLSTVAPNYRIGLG